MGRAEYLPWADGGTVAVDTSLDSVLALLSAHRRRAALYVLADAGTDGLFVVDLARQVTPLIGADDVETVLTELIHADLPQLGAAGVVEYEEDSGMVRATGDDTVDQLLEYTKAIELSE